VTSQTTLLHTAADFRHGIVLPPEEVELTAADISGVVNFGVPANSEDPWASATGGIAWEREGAASAAIGEALERYAAAAFPFPERWRSQLSAENRLDAAAFSLYSEDQRAQPGFPHEPLYTGDVAYTNVFSLRDNEETWVPSALVTLASAEGSVATSTGLAAGPNTYVALLRAVQELIERDALAVTWLHGIPGLRVDLPTDYTMAVRELGGTAICFDATPAYSPHPVALVAGELLLRGARRIALGAACRETWRQAVEKAFLEWLQGISYAGFHLESPSGQPRAAQDLKTFEDHALYYTLHPEEWDEIPLLRGDGVGPIAGDEAPSRASDSVARLSDRLFREGVRIFYRELTTPDLDEVGVRVIRVLSPDLAPLACDEEWRFLGGTVGDVCRRYPWASRAGLTFPSDHPHPLG
jgi:ribosomal protein S12 methylthiotransferase accessory factor